MDDKMYRGEGGTALRFYEAAVKNNFQSEQNGRAVFDKVLYVDVLTPGSNESAPQFEVIRTYCEEFGLNADGSRKQERGPKYVEYQKQVEAFLSESGEGTLSGTPITQWPAIDVSTAASMKAAGIHTVEQLAEVSDGNLQNLGTGGRVLREQARGFIQTRQFGVPTAQITAENANLRDENDRLTQTIAQLNDTVASLQAQVNAAGRTTLPPQPVIEPVTLPPQSVLEPNTLPPQPDALFGNTSAAAPSVI